MTQRLVFDSSVDALFVKRLGPRLGGEGRAKLREAGLDLNQKLLPAYPAEKVASWIDLAVPHAYPGDRRWLHRAPALDLISPSAAARAASAHARAC